MFLIERLRKGKLNISSLELRMAGPEDIPPVRALYKTVWLKEFSFLPAEHLDTKVISEKFRSGAKALVIWNQDELLGYLLFSSDATGIKIEHLYVRPDVQGRGIGTRLVNELLSMYGGSQKIAAEVWDGNSKAHVFYRRLFFQPSEETNERRFGEQKVEYTLWTR